MPPSARTLIASDRVLVLGHRGNSHAFPENTLPAFRSAAALSVDFVELDYRHSADGVPIVIHDERLGRTTDAPRRWPEANLALAMHTAAELRELDAGSWRGPEFAGTRLSTLAETLEALPDSCFMIERKTGSAAVCVDLLARLKAFDRTIVQAFDHTFLEECRRLSPQIILGALGEKELSDAVLERAHAFGMAVIGWKAADWTAEAVARTHRAGFKAWAWTVDEPAEAERLLAAGIDALISNAPGRIMEVVARTPRR